MQKGGEDMSFLDKAKKYFEGRFRQNDSGQIPSGRVSSSGQKKNLSPYRSISANVLDELRSHSEQAEAIHFLKGVNSDVSMAVWNFVRLSNLGNEIEFTDLGGRRMMGLEDEWREFAARINSVSNSGLDGLIDILHQLAFVRGAQALEVEVSKDRKKIIDVHPIIPQSITWELEEVDGRETWVPYQQQMMKKVRLDKANFYWVPTDPDADDPRGNLILAPVLQSVDFQMQIMQDLAAVLHHQGWPRNDIQISLERLMQKMPPDVRSGKRKINNWLQEEWNRIVEQMDSLEPDSDYIHFDDIEIKSTEGANTNRSLDVRAIAELVDTQTMSGAKQMSIFMNRNAGVTETWGSVQFRIFCNGIASIQRGSKRLIEDVARLWLRVNGVQAVPSFKHNKIDWESEEQKATVKLMWQEYWAIAQLMGWVDADKAAEEGVGSDGASSDKPDESARVSFGFGGDVKHDKERRKPSQDKDSENILHFMQERDG